MFECSDKEAEQAFLHRFAVAGAAVRYRALHGREVEDILSLDIALKRNENDWFEQLPADAEGMIVAKLYYGHFLCHVLHQDYIVRRGARIQAQSNTIHALLDARGAEYPAEHNVGHLYHAKPAQIDHAHSARQTGPDCLRKDSGHMGPNSTAPLDREHP